MPLKPVDQRGTRNRENMWKAMQELGTFTIHDIGHKTLINNGTIAAYLQGLENAGFVKVKKQRIHEFRTQNTYTVIKHQKGTPRVRKDGSEIPPNLGTEQMWRSIKMMSAFTVKDLSTAASTDEVQVKLTTVKDYIKYLNKAGYLRILRKSKPGILAIYRLNPSKNTGPKPPQIQRVKQVYDQNLKKVVWPTEGEET